MSLANAASVATVTPGQMTDQLNTLATDLSNLSTLFTSYMYANNGASTSNSASNSASSAGTPSVASSVGGLSPSTLSALIASLDQIVQAVATDVSSSVAAQDSSGSSPTAASNGGSPTTGPATNSPATIDPALSGAGAATTPTTGAVSTTDDSNRDVVATASTSTGSGAPTTPSSGGAASTTPASDGASATASTPASSSSTTADTAYLLPPGTTAESWARPSLAQFMQATGADPSTASDILYGTIGSNTDLRDWAAIMKSADPLASARASTAAMLNSSLAFESPNGVNASTAAASTQNFAYIAAGKNSPAELVLTAGQGETLRVETSPQSLLTDATNFGFDLTQLTALQAQLIAQGVKYEQGPWANGFLPTTQNSG